MIKQFNRPLGRQLIDTFGIEVELSPVMGLRKKY
jgi:hypothetical protein